MYSRKGPGGSISVKRRGRREEGRWKGEEEERTRGGDWRRGDQGRRGDGEKRGGEEERRRG